jgi:hypothetical protein
VLIQNAAVSNTNKKAGGKLRERLVGRQAVERAPLHASMHDET